MEELRLWVWLTSLQNMTGEKITKLLDVFETVSQIYQATDYSHVEGLRKKDIASLQNKSFQTAHTIMEECKRFGIRILTYDSPSYPELLRHIFDPPYVLYVWGKEKIQLSEQLCVAMVGTRRMSAYGREVAMELGRDLARAGILVVSGMAKGVDAAAHWGALSGGGKTVAVLGCGIEQCYPPENRELREEILASGMVISEYPPGVRPLPEHFPARNRIISGLCRGVIIIEAPERSGALITARLALEQGRDVFAVPGNLNQPNSAGSNQLIRSGATLVTDALDVIEEYRGEYLALLEHAAAKVIEARGKPADSEEKALKQAKQSIDSEAYRALAPEDRSIFDALSLTPVHIDTLVHECGLPAAVLNAKLTVLEMKDLVKRLPGNHFVLKT